MKRKAITFLNLAAFLLTAASSASVAKTLDEQLEEYNAAQSKTIIELQPFRDEILTVLPDTETQVRFISLNPTINSWFLLQVGEDGNYAQQTFHIENPYPTTQRVALMMGEVPTLIVSNETSWQLCDLWSGEPSQLALARDSHLPFAPICDGKLYLRNKVAGSQTSIEATTEFLRDNVWQGESIVRFVKSNFFKDSEVENSDQLDEGGTSLLDVGPGAAAVEGLLEDRAVISTQHGLAISGTEPGRMTVGLWYPVIDLPDVFVSAIQPDKISNAIFDGPGVANNLDYVERRATDYLVAFDLSKFDIGLALGTTHPRIDWSPRPAVRDYQLPGPDGVRDARPLVRLGMVNPLQTDSVVATFTAGFKREHGAFKWGEYSNVDNGTHYGFIENGVIFSKLHANLSTFYILDDGTINMKTWTEEDNALLPRIRHARQNGVPLVNIDPETGIAIPGDKVIHWGPGNWSGSAEAQLRTVRGGACINEVGDKRYLIYGYFSTATPSAMARVFQAYGCEYAMLLDMNALEHTYLALYVHRDGGVHVEHLVPGMKYIDKSAYDGTLSPRFIGFPDNRDVFYLTRRED